MPQASDATRKMPIAASALTRSSRLSHPIATAVAMQKMTTATYGAHALSSAGNASANSHAVPAPPSALCPTPSPINAHRRSTTATDNTAHAAAIAVAVRRAFRRIGSIIRVHHGEHGEHGTWQKWMVDGGSWI